MRTLILSKTRMNRGRVCVGGVFMDSGRMVRLLTESGENQPENAKVHIGDIWDITFNEPSSIIAPHTEDILATAASFVSSNNNIANYLNDKKIKIWKGRPTELFDGNLGWTNNRSGYISEWTGVPDQSTGFWKPDKDLIKQNGYYVYGGRYRLKNVSLVDLGDVIPAESLVRVSLARWWTPEPDVEERCYLQLSGKY